MINSKNIMKIETISTKEYYYIIMVLCPILWKIYFVKSNILIDEIKEIFI